MNNRVAPEAHKLGGSFRGGIGACAAAAVLVGCATEPTEPVSEKLDPDTATTVTILNHPIELLSQTGRSRQTDPFAYIAPFETNRMGSRDLFLWVSTPQAQGALTPPQVMCNGQPLNLQPLDQKPTSASGSSVPANDTSATNPAGRNVSPGTSADQPVTVDLAKLSLSRAPYDSPVPWSTQWYFRLPPDSLKCLADAEGISLEAKSVDGGPDQFSASGRKNLASLDAFSRR